MYICTLTAVLCFQFDVCLSNIYDHFLTFYYYKVRSYMLHFSVLSLTFLLLSYGEKGCVILNMCAASISEAYPR